MSTAAHWAPEAEVLQRLRHVALGRRDADLVIENCRLVCLHTCEIMPANVAICGAFIAAIAPPEHNFGALETVQAEGRYLLPTFIDTHIHIEYSLVTPGEFARCVIPKGTGCVMADPNCVGNVLGEQAMHWAGQTDTPLKILQQISHRIPRAPKLELGGATVADEEQHQMLGLSQAVSVGESTPFGFDDRAARLQAAALALGKRNTGHSARVRGADLWAYAATGISDDHNAFDPEEIAERLRLGMMITVMAGSMNDNVPPIFASAERFKDSFAQFSFCADDKHVGDLQEQGHIDHHVRQAIACGVPVLEAYRMATLYPAQFYRIDHLLGSITPGRRADMMLIADLEQALPEQVWLDGQLAFDKLADGEQLRFGNGDVVPDWLYDTMHLHPSIGADTFRVPADAAPGEVAVVAAMEMYDGYFKRAFNPELAVVDGNVIADPTQDVAKIAVLDRHHATETSACGFVRGFGLQRGALASTTNCENQNLVVVGTSDADMAFAAQVLAKAGGGYVAVADGRILALMPLPLAGIMSDKPWEQVVEELERVNEAAAELGSEMHAPFMILAFVGLAGIPDYGLTEKGLIDTPTQTFIPVVQCCRCPQHVHASSLESSV